MTDDHCLFCGIGAGKPVVPKLYEDDLVYAIDIPDDHPKKLAPVHFMVIPRAHRKSALELTDADAETAGRLFTTAARLARDKGIADSGFRLATNTGPHANQTEMHFHLHCIGGRQLGREG